MKYLIGLLLILQQGGATAQKAENIIIVTLDGFRWQEVFKGMDSSIANNSTFNQEDSLLLFQKYWGATEKERRKKILPFLWGTVEQQGQIYGNRELNSKVDNANRYWFSYPGYNEIFTGFPDTAINSNGYPPNPHTNILEFMNGQPRYKNKVAAFTAWDAFNRILNEERSKVPVIAAFDKIPGTGTTERVINQLLQDSYKPFGNAECLDVFTHHAAFNYLKTARPRILYIAYGETDEWAHSGHYRDYLNAAWMADKWINDLWNYIESDPFYKNRTALFISTDHGRGDIMKAEWTSHGQDIEGASQIWFAVLGPGVTAKGEVKNSPQYYQKQFAQTIAALIGQKFKATHPIAEQIELNQ